jgi:hypothetical protein
MASKGVVVSDESGNVCVCVETVDGLLKVLSLLLARKGKKSGLNWLMIGSFV